VVQLVTIPTQLHQFLERNFLTFTCSIKTLWHLCPLW